jgi:hypothetical protein
VPLIFRKSLEQSQSLSIPTYSFSGFWKYKEMSDIKKAAQLTCAAFHFIKA